MQYSIPYFAQAYSEGAYGEGGYSCTEQQQAAGECSAAGGTAGSGSGSGLIDTGVAVLALITVASLVIFAVLVVRMWRRPQPVPQEIEDTEPPASRPDQPPSID